jgi:ABC-type dipeptide/oligopeptide/nickel transport system ATPase subunit
VSISKNDKRKLVLSDKKDYIDVATNKEVNIIDKNIAKIYENDLSTGQLQRLLILMGLMRFHVSDQPILIGDEFLVNFTYLEAEKLLNNIIKYFFEDNEAKNKHKLAIFILHDLSFDLLKSLKPDYPVKIIGLENVNASSGRPEIITSDRDTKKKQKRKITADCQNLVSYKIPYLNFINGNFEDNNGAQFFSDLKDSYNARALTRDECKLDIQFSDESYPYNVHIKEENSPLEGMYNEENDVNYEKKLFKGVIDLTLKKNRVIVLTGFSGCGKSTLSKLFVEKNVKEKRTFRYFPDKPLSSLSEDSQVSVRDDLAIMYKYYNKVEDIEEKECKESIARIINHVHFYENKTIESGIEVDEFMNKRIFNLSGGEQQRYWLARLLFDYDKDEEGGFKLPELFILDESIASLDCITKNKIIAFLLEKVFSGKSATLLLISHDLRDIEVIYKTLLEQPNVEEENINKVFEHYEMLDGNLFKVENGFTEYRKNLNMGTENSYFSFRDNKKLQLKFKGAQDNDGEK